MKELCEPHTQLIIIGVLIVVIIAISAGKGVGALLVPALRKILGSGEVNVNVGSVPGEAVAPGIPPGLTMLPCLIDPKNCTSHQAENERSLENKDKIEKLDTEFHDFKKGFFAKLESIESGVGEIKVAVAQLTVESSYQQGIHGKR